MGHASLTSDAAALRAREMSVSRKNVLVAHPSKHTYVYEVAVALQTHGRLLRFVTGIYDKRDCWFSRVARSASLIARPDQIERLLSKRRHEALDDADVTTWPAAELLSRTVGRWRPVEILTRERSGYLFVNWWFDRAVARALRSGRYRPDAVYGFLGAALHTFAACRELGIRTILDVPIILSAADTMAEERRAAKLTAGLASSPNRHIARELAAADWIVAPAAAVVESIRAAGYQGGVSEVPFGADVEAFQPGPPRSGPFRVVYAGRIEPRKGAHHLVEAWHTARVPGELLLVGSAPDAEFIRGLRQQYGGTVREAGNVTTPELARLLADADVFALPSLAEGSALVSYEALAAGLPCIVTHETGSVVRDGIEGFIVPPRAPGVLAARIRELHDNVALRRRMSLAARARAEEFSWKSYHERFVAAIDLALTSTSSTQPAVT